MSATFDPSNLDLNPENEVEAQKKDISSIDEQQDTSSNDNTIHASINDNDILGELDTNSHKEKKQDPDLQSDNNVIEEKWKDKWDLEIQHTEWEWENENIEEENTSDQEETKLIDINIASLEDIIRLVDDKKYDYVILEPEDLQVKVTFKQDNIDRDTRYIKYPTYTNILFKTKQLTKLVVEDSGSPQEWKGKLKLGSKVFKLSSKTSPGQNGERLFIASKEDTSEVAKKEAKKTSLSVIFWFLAAILFVGLVLWGAFIGFIVFNAQTVEDVKFFASLGINLNQINTFISLIVSIIFSILLFISTTILSVFLFKFFITKKSYRRKKVVYWILSTLLLFVTFATGSAWMFIDNKIKSLPNWQEQAYWDLKIFNNDLLISKDFDTSQALLSETQDLIGPITLQFDLENFETNQARKGITIKKYLWEFWGESEETFSPKITRTFDEKGNYEVSVTAFWTDSGGAEVEQVISNIPSISISHLVSLEETLTSNGGKRLSFDANDLSDLGKISWYFKEPISDTNPEPSYPEWEKIEEGYDFIPGKIFFEELFVGIAISDGEAADESISKVIVISPDWASDISGNITHEQNLENELLYTFTVENASTWFANGFIESYTWTIEDKTYTVNGDLSDPSTSPEIEHEFSSFGDQEIEVLLTDSKGKTETIRKTLSIQKKVSLRAPLMIRDDNSEEIEELRYEEKTHEYFIDNFGVPAWIELDARLVRPVNILYSLTDVSWDVWNDGDIDGRGKSFEYFVPTEGNHVIVAEYTFTHRKKPDDTISLKEFVYIEWIKKEAILNLKMEFDSNYAPVTVRFDASESFIKQDDIVKFIYDYGDGISEERDAINPWHKYTEAGDYTVTLTVVGKSWKRYSTSKQLILLPPAQTVEISSSLKRAPVGQWIDFSSSKSSGQIVEYFWDFGDGNVSTEANPTHSYSRPWTYTASLKADFANNNSITDEVEIEIFEQDE